LKYIERNITKSVKAAWLQFPTVTLTGPRQSGKSTFAQAIFSDLLYINFESTKYQSLATEDPEGFVRNYPDGAVFDEIQKVPELFSAIQVFVDEQKKIACLCFLVHKTFHC
jgi:uncharacterized protein